MHKRTMAFALFCILGTASVASASTALYQPLAPASFAGTNQSFNFTMGYSFTPNKNITVTHLGGAFYMSKTVALYSGTSGGVIASATVAGSGTSYAYTPLKRQVVLQANTTYTIGVQLNGTGGNYYSSAGGSNLLAMSNNDITINDGCFIEASTANPCSANGTLAYVFGVPDLMYTGGSGLPCGEITQPGYYTLTGDLPAPTSGGTASNCLYLHDFPAGPATTIDCQNHSIMGGTDTSGTNGKAILVKNLNNYSGVTIKNCTLDSKTEIHPLTIESSSLISLSNSNIGLASPGNSAVRVYESLAVSITSSTIDGEVDVESSSQVNVSQNHINCASNVLQSVGIGFSLGSWNTASGNTIVGNWNGVAYPDPNTKGCDDGIEVATESYDSVTGNQISNVFDAGIETYGFVAYSHFDNNTFSQLTGNAGAAIGGWYHMGLLGNTFIGNTANQCHALFWFLVDFGFGYTDFYFQNNTFSNNTATNLPGARDGMHGPGVPSTALGGIPVHETGNVFTGNNWGSNTCPPNFFDTSIPSGNVIDQGGNICSPGSCGSTVIQCH